MGKRTSLLILAVSSSFISTASADFIWWSPVSWLGTSIELSLRLMINGIDLLIRRMSPAARIKENLQEAMLSEKDRVLTDDNIRHTGVHLKNTMMKSITDQIDKDVAIEI